MKNEFTEQIAQQIKKLRLEKGETLGQLANRFNATAPLELTVERSTLNRYELGEITIPADKYLKLLSLYNNNYTA